MFNPEINTTTFKCAVEGCDEPAFQELWEDFEGRTLYLSVCRDAEHQSIARDFLKEKADIGRACLEFESGGCLHNDCDISDEQAWDIRLSDALNKYMKTD